MTFSRSPAIVVSLCAVLVACAAAAHAWRPSAVELVDSVGSAQKPVMDVAASMEGAFEWSADRRLTWADFLGSPDMGSEAVATTVTVVGYQMSCTGTDFTWQVVSRFVPRGSWVKPNHLLQRQSAQTLLHEQGHFDLSEVHARRARANLRGLAAPCALTDDEQNALIAGFQQQGHALQVQYDRETAHGTDARRQREWEGRVEAWLRTIPK